MSQTDPTHVLLVGHGTVDSLADMPRFLANIRRGHPAPPEVVAEVVRRYEAIGGRSPLMDICRAQAEGLAARLGHPVHLAMRLWRPYVKDVVAEAADAGATTLAVVPLAPYSAKVYEGDVRRVVEARRAAGLSAPAVVAADDWGLEPALVAGFAARLREAVLRLPAERRDRARVILSAHSLPLAVLRAGDPYEREVKATAEAVVRAAALPNPHHVAFQSQGMTQDPWLGPDLPATLDAIAAAGGEDVVVAAIGFLTDHVEILYDLDLEAKALAADRGLSLSRTESLNASPAILDALEAVARRALAGGG